MNGEFKYIMMKGGPPKSMESIFIFPVWENHRRIAERLGGIDHVLSAGFLKIKVVDGKIKGECYGASISLGISSRPIDSACLTLWLD